MQNLIALLAVANLALTAYVLVRVFGLEGRTTRSTSALTRVDRAAALVAGVDQIRAGIDRATVENLLGIPANPHEKEWLYYLDRHSGYTVKFDDQDRVESIAGWYS